MKSKIAKIIFIISFLPCLLILLYAINNAFFGIVIFEKLYGYKAFWVTIIIMFRLLVMGIPVIPGCFIYQVCYILRSKVEKFKNINSKKYIIICCVAGAIIIIIWKLLTDLWF